MGVTEIAEKQDDVNWTKAIVGLALIALAVVLFFVL